MKLVPIAQEKFIRKNNMENVEGVFFRIAVPDIRRYDKKIPAGDGIAVVLDIVPARAFGNDVDFVKFVRVHLDGKIIFMKIAKQHNLFFLLVG